MKKLALSLILAFTLIACKGDEIIVDNDTPNCPEGTIFDNDSNACIPEYLTDEIFDLLLTIKDCFTGDEMDVDSVTFVDVVDGYEQEQEKLLNQPEGVYMVLNVIMGHKYYIEIENDGYETLEGEFQVTQQTDEVCLDPLNEDVFYWFQMCLDVGNTMGLCCLNYPDPALDITCNR